MKLTKAQLWAAGGVAVIAIAGAAMLHAQATTRLDMTCARDGAGKVVCK